MLHNNLFEINLFTLAIQLMPTNRRTPIHMAFIKVLVSPFNLLLQELKKHRADNIYKLQHDSRLGSVQKVLNDKFDKVLRRITIIEGQRLNQNYSYYSTENKEPLETPFYTYSADEITEFTADFEICIPIAVGLIESDITRLNTLARYYADKDKHFIIKLV
jgi:hypothetical protein